MVVEEGPTGLSKRLESIRLNTKRRGKKVAASPRNHRLVGGNDVKYD